MSALVKAELRSVKAMLASVRAALGSVKVMLAWVGAGSASGRAAGQAVWLCLVREVSPERRLA
jgi:hypothetical protein